METRKTTVRDTGEVVFVVLCFLNCDLESTCIRVIQTDYLNPGVQMVSPGSWLLSPGTRISNTPPVPPHPQIHTFSWGLSYIP